MPPERSLSRRVLPFALLALLAAGWLVARPASRDANLLAFPVALILVALLLLDAARTPRPKAAPEAPLRRHEQIVRDLPDPETRQLEAALAAWVRDGTRADEAASILARATGREAAETLPEISRASSRRQREALILKTLDHGDMTT